MKIAIIPARGGSKRIPKKNIKDFLGKPIICWSIKAAQDSGLFDKIIVSTDDKDISNIAQSYGAEVPFVRPSNLSDDITPTVPVIKHATNFYLDLGLNIDYACCIYPCAPFVTKEDIKKSFKILASSDQSFCYPITEYSHPIQRALKINAEGKLSYYNNKKMSTVRTQDLDITFHDCGQFYWGKVSGWIEDKIMHTDAVGYIVKNSEFVDIDNLDDWERAENIFKLRTNRKL